MNLETFYPQCCYRQESRQTIGKLYGVEKEAKGKPSDERVALRQKKAKPIFNEL